MNIQKYNYYGNYENDNSNLFSVNDIQKKQFEREKNRKKIYHIITKKCFQKIKETSNNEDTYCFFQLPEFIPGFPLFNMTECVMYLLEILKEKGFSSRYVDGFMIYISWYKPKNNVIMLEDIKKENVLDNMNLKYKPIEKSNLFTDFIPRKKN